MLSAAIDSTAANGMDAVPPSPTGDQLIARARAMVASLCEREAEAIANRQVSAETIKAFSDAGFDAFIVKTNQEGVRYEQ